MVSVIIYRILVLCWLLNLCVPECLVAQQIEIDGRQYVGAATVGKRFGMHGYWLEKDKILRLTSKQTRVDIVKDSRLLRINDMPVYLGFPTRELQGQFFVALADYHHVFQSVLTPHVFENKPKVKRIVIDAGHGGKDTGARNDAYGLLEKDLTLDVARRLKTLLKQSGFEVVLIRDRDVYIPLDKRSEISNRFDADLFLSLHFNAAASTSASGFECFALTPQYQASTKKPKPSVEDDERFPGNDFDPWNMLIAYHVERALSHGLNEPERGVKRARFLVLKNLDCPGVLVELGFVSHMGTAIKLRSKSYRQSIAQNLYEGILAYQKRLQRIQ